MSHLSHFTATTSEIWLDSMMWGFSRLMDCIYTEVVPEFTSRSEHWYKQRPKMRLLSSPLPPPPSSALVSLPVAWSTWQTRKKKISKLQRQPWQNRNIEVPGLHYFTFSPDPLCFRQKDVAGLRRSSLHWTLRLISTHLLPWKGKTHRGMRRHWLHGTTLTPFPGRNGLKQCVRYSSIFNVNTNTTAI